jgi:DNA modification methylase
MTGTEADIPINEIICGDCLSEMSKWPDSFIQCVVTSPPYWGLRDYGTATWEGGDAECGHIDADKLAERRRQRKSMIAVGERCDGSTRTRVHDEQIGKDCQYLTNCKKCGAKRTDQQLGLEKTPEEYAAKMVTVFREVRRVLRDDGTLWLNLGSSYASSGMGGNPEESQHRKQATNAGSLIKGRTPSNGFKHKDMVPIPWMVAMALQADGWYLRQDIIWSKPNPMPESVTDRCTKAHEYLFLLTKKPRYFYDAQAIKEPNADPNRTSFSPGKRRMSDEMVVAAGDKHRGFGNTGKSMDAYPGAGRNKRSVWEVTTQPFPDAHFATFPPKLIEPCILAGTSKKGRCPECGGPWERVVEKPEMPTVQSSNLDRYGTGDAGVHRKVGQAYQDWRSQNPDKTLGWRPTCECGCEKNYVCEKWEPCIVFDPFAGSGTTCVVAAQLGRDYTGTELNPEYVAMARKRLEAVETGVSVKEADMGQMAMKTLFESEAKE